MKALIPEPVDWRSPRPWVALAVLGMLVLVPLYAHLANQPFYLTLFGRIMIYAIAACSLNLLIGYTGLVSFGHALYLALGAYTVGIPAAHELGNGWLHLALALASSAVVATLIGLIVLRTSGMGFIMITLAFAQMFFFLGLSLKQYGGDDGMRLAARSALAPLALILKPSEAPAHPFSCRESAAARAPRLPHGRHPGEGARNRPGDCR